MSDLTTAITETTVTEWRVESESLEDEFGTDEEAAREWLDRCKAHPDWEPSVLMSRTVVTQTYAWLEVTR